MVEEHWIEDLEEFEASSQDNPPGSTRKPRRRFFQRGNLPFVLLGAGALLLLLIVGAGLLGGNGQTDERASLQEMAARLTKLQKQIEAVQARQDELLQRMSDLEPEYKFDTLFQNVNTLSNEMEAVKKELETELSALDKKLAKAGAEQRGDGGSPPASPDSGSGGEQAARVHVVEKGDNLYRIGLQYGVEPGQIRKWNDLGPEEPIYPGQELIVSPE